MTAKINPGHDAVIKKGWLAAHKWLLLRRISQLGILSLFLSGPLFGIWIIKGNIASSLTLDVLPLSDPFILIQSLFAGHWPEFTAFIGAGIILGFYFLVGGRVYCGWICPVNIITDAAAWLRQKLAIKGGVKISQRARYWILAMSFFIAALTGSLVWELVNPVTLLYRGLIFGTGMVIWLVLVLFLFDLLVSPRGWCSHLCPMGAFYSLLAMYSPLRISAVQRSKCNDCMDCYAVCPEPQVIPPALKPKDPNLQPVITGINCTNCARCIDVCSKDVFAFTTRFYKSPESNNKINHSEVLS